MIFDFVKKSIKNNPLLRYWGYCYNKRNDSVYRDIFEGNNIFFPVISSGDEQQGKHFYAIQIGLENVGMCGLIRDTLAYLYVADYFGLTPVVEYTGNTLYAEQHPVNGATNPFLYYFLPVNDYQTNVVSHARCVMRAIPQHNHWFYRDVLRYKLEPDMMRKLALMQQKYLKLNDTAAAYIHSGVFDICTNRKVLGVHVRGTDMKLQFKRHPIAATTQEYIALVEKALEKYAFQYIFLATDEADTTRQFQEAFGDKVLFYDDTYRSTDGSAIHYNSSENRTNHKYMLGLEVLRDAYTLAACDALIAGYSAVSQYAQIVNGASKTTFSFVTIIDKGIHRSAREFSKYFKAHK